MSDLASWVDKIISCQTDKTDQKWFLRSVWQFCQSRAPNKPPTRQVTKWAIKKCNNAKKTGLEFGAADFCQLYNMLHSGTQKNWNHLSPIQSHKTSTSKKGYERRALEEFVETLDPRAKLPKYKAEVQCPKCGQDKFITALTIQTRRADEMQVIQYKCSNHDEAWVWKG